MIHTSLQAREIIAKKTLQFIPSPFVAYNIWTSSAPDLAINGSSDRFRFSPEADSKPEHEPTFNVSLYIKEPRDYFRALKNILHSFHILGLETWIKVSLCIDLSVSLLLFHSLW